MSFIQALPQQLPGMQPRDAGCDPQQPVSPAPATLAPFFTPEALEVTDKSFFISLLWQCGQAICSSCAKMRCSEVDPHSVQIYSKIGIFLVPLSMVILGFSLYPGYRAQADGVSGRSRHHDRARHKCAAGTFQAVCRFGSSLDCLEPCLA